MRVDSPAPGTTAPGDIDARAQVKRYLDALRRSWYVLAALTVLGAGLGWWSAGGAELPAAQQTRYYRATHTLLREVDDPTGRVPPGQVSLAQAAYLVGTGAVPAEVAKQLDLDIGEVEGRLVGIPRTQVSSIEIQAIGHDPTLVAEMADDASSVLLEKLEAQAKKAFDEQRDETVLKLARLDDDISAINARIAAEPQNRPQLEAQQRSLTNQYSLTYEQFAQLANQGTPSAGLTSLQDAKAEEISKREYQTAKEDIREGLPYVTGAPTPATDETRTGGVGGGGQATSRPTRAVLGGLLGLALGVAIVLGLYRFDNRLRHRDDVETATGLPVLAEIPPLSRHQQNSLEVVAHTQHRSRAAEAYRVVRSALLFAVNAGEEDRPRPDGEGLVLMVTSANPEEGKTTTVANLAAVLAEGGYSVLVVNCDFRRPRVHKYLVQGDTKAQRQASERDPGAVVITNTRIDRVKLVTGVGENDPDANPLDVVAMQRKIIAMARNRYDVVLLDTAPFLTTNDASELLSETDQVLLVVRAGRTRRLAARRTAEILERFDAPVLGVVMNDSDETPAAQYYYSYYLDGSGRKRRTDGYVSPSVTPAAVGNGRGAGTNGTAGPVPASAPARSAPPARPS